MADVRNVFVLILENRSFDHMLGFSAITGFDAATGAPTAVDGLDGTQSNQYQGQTYTVAHPAPDTMPVDPGHEFADVLMQLCGPGAVYAPGAAYPAINNSGFVADYVESPSPEEGKALGTYGDIMRCLSPEQLPVLNALAREFAVCDHWHASMPGPTWPNRFFVHAGSSGGLDDSPTNEEIFAWETLRGFELKNGTVFDALAAKSATPWRIYTGGDFPNVAALKGIHQPQLLPFNDFAKDVENPSYPWLYTFIEPNYGDILNGTYEGGTSQHPLDGVAHGEALIKTVYESIRKSPHWNKSLLIVTWDEHGGFYDHVAPPSAVAPGDAGPGSTYNKHGFTFEQLGVRVPAVVVSPWIPQNRIDHQLYDHASIPATLQQLFGIPALTNRDAAAHDVTPLLSLPALRTDTPITLSNPAFPVAPPIAQRALPPENSVNTRSLPGFLNLAMRRDMAMSDPAAQPAIVARVRAIQTRGEAAQYIQQVQAKMRAAGQSLA
jgi:phospholipase C